MRRIAVIGASGFVGSSLVETLRDRNADEVIPFIRSSGNAWRLARLGTELRTLDVLDADQVAEALRGVTHVVNCARGGDDVMLKGLANLLAACKRNRIERFVHLGSVAVYGDPPPPESAHETAPTEPVRGSYGWLKLRQDRMVAKACREGLRGVVICPPNIGGTYSVYLLGLVEALRAQEFVLLDDGSAPCNLVDVYNLCHAIDLALDDGPVDGARLFVTDDEQTTWGDLIERLLPLTESTQPPPAMSRDELSRLGVPTGAGRISILRSLKHLVSSDVRQALRKDPLWQTVDTSLRRGIAHMGRPIESALRNSVEGSIRIAKVESGPRINAQLSRQQLRGVWHSCNAAKAKLRYQPVNTFAQSIDAFYAWYRWKSGMQTEVWPLLRQLER